MYCIVSYDRLIYGPFDSQEVADIYRIEELKGDGVICKMILPNERT